MGYKSTLLTAGAAIVCTNGVYADVNVEATKSFENKTATIDSSMQKARTSRGGSLAAQGDIGDRAGGDTPFSPTVIAALPFTDTGNNSLNTDAGDELCADTVSGPGGGLDQWYSYNNLTSSTLSISLCGASTNYDTKLYIYAGAIAPGSPVACEDDTCSAGLGNPWVSELVAFLPAATLFIAVDSWTSTDVGNFELAIGGGTIVPCTTDCLSTDTINPGPCAFGADGDDGCFAANQDEFFAINCEETVCGTMFTDSAMQVRDLDWYQLTLTQTNDVTASFVTENPSGAQLFFVDVTAIGGCAPPGSPQGVSFIVSVGTGCTSTGIVATGLVAGDYWFIPAAFGTDGSIDCPNAQDYRLGITCDCGPYLVGNTNGDDQVNFDDLNNVPGNWEASCSN